MLYILTPTHYYITAYNCGARPAQQHYEKYSGLAAAVLLNNFWTALARNRPRVIVRFIQGPMSFVASKNNEEEEHQD
jgi:hypothetical protein